MQPSSEENTSRTTQKRLQIRVIPVAIFCILTLNALAAGYYIYQNWWMQPLLLAGLHLDYPRTWSVVKDPDTEEVLIDKTLVVNQYPTPEQVATTPTTGKVTIRFGSIAYTDLTKDPEQGKPTFRILSITENGSTAILKYPLDQEWRLWPVLSSVHLHPSTESHHGHAIAQ